MAEMKRSVVITGVSSGIGEATAALFSNEGWEVFGISRRIPQEKGSLAHHVRGDISKQEDISRAFNEIAGFTDSLDALVNNAAQQICKPLIEMNSEEWDSIFNTNVKSAFICSKYGYPLLKKNGGAIVNVSSVHALATSANIAAYAASKGALLAFTRAAAIEFGKDNIRVNAVLPGAVDTPMLHEGLVREGGLRDNQEQLLEKLSEKHIMKRIGKPGEIAEVIYFLSDSQKSSFITGQSIIADGGAMARLSTE